MLQDNHTTSSHMLVAGDCNYPQRNWETISSSAPDNHPTHVFLEKLADLFLIQHVTKPTRYRNRTVPSLLDLVITTEEGMIPAIKYIPCLGNSDHLALIFTAHCYTLPKAAKLTKRALNQADFNLLRSKAAEVDWAQIRSMHSQCVYEFLERAVLMLVERHGRGKAKNLYMNRDALRL